MLSPSIRTQVKEILLRISKGDTVNLEERFLIQKLADKDQSVESWLKRARRLQQNSMEGDCLDDLLKSLDLGSTDPNSSYNPTQEDLGDWFLGAPSWLNRS